MSEEKWKPNPKWEVKKTKRISMRISDDDRAMYQAAADRDGYKNIAGWIKWLIRQRIKEQESGD